MQPYVTTSGLLALLGPCLAAIALVVVSLFVRQRKNGWRHVAPGLGYWLAFALGGGLALLIAWVWALVGSSRPDGESQMRIAWWLAFIFGIMALWCAWRMFGLERLGLRWRGDKVSWQKSGKPLERSLLGATGIASGFGGRTSVMFSNGDGLAIDIAAHNASDLIARIEQLNGLSDPDAPPEH